MQLPDFRNCETKVPLTRLSKPELQELAGAVGVCRSGTKAEICKRIAVSEKASKKDVKRLTKVISGQRSAKRYGRKKCKPRAGTLSFEDLLNPPILDKKPMAPAPILDKKPMAPAPIFVKKPVAPAPFFDKKPVAPAPDKKPDLQDLLDSLGALDSLDTPPVFDEKPVAPVFDEKPVAPVFDEKPVTPVFDEKPVTQASDDTLKNFLDSLKIPTTPLPQASDYADMPDLENLAPVLPKTRAKKSVQFAPGVKEEAISEDLGRIGCKYLPIGIIKFLMDTCGKAGNEANTTECMIDFLLPAINYSSQTLTQRKQLYGRIKTKLNQPCSDPTQTDYMKYLGINFATGYDNFIQGITTIPKRPCNSFKIGKFLGSGESGAVFVACYSAECNLVVKIQRLDDKWETETKIASYVNDNFNSLAPRLDLICVASLDDMFGAPENKGDLEYLKLVKDIAPLVPNYLNAKMGFMVLERFEGNLKQLAPQEFCSESDLRKRVRKRLDILHDNFIYHLDMSLENILYRRDQEDGDLWVAITDFGLSIAPKLIPLTAEEERNEINFLINRAKKGGFKLDKSNVRWPMGLVEYAEAFDWAMFDHTFDAYKKLTCDNSKD